MTTAGSVGIDKPIAEVFDYTVNNVAEWSVTVVEEKVIEQTTDGVGSRFHVLIRDPGGKPMEFDGTVTFNERPTAQTVVMIGKQFDIEGSRGEDEGDPNLRCDTEGFHDEADVFGVRLTGKEGGLQGSRKGTRQLEGKD